MLYNDSSFEDGKLGVLHKAQFNGGCNVHRFVGNAENLVLKILLEMEAAGSAS